VRPRHLLAGYSLFSAAYFGLFALRVPHWLANALLVCPAGVAAGLHFWRAGRELGRARWFWRLTGLGPALWALGTAFWALAEYQGYQPGAGTGAPQLRGFPVLLDVLFVGFYVPMACAVAMRPHPRARRPDLAALTEIGLITVAVSFFYLRLVFLPVVDPDQRPWRLVFGLLSFVLVVWSAAFWRWLQDPAWKRTYGLIALFALLYVFLDSLATNFGNTSLPPGGPTDLAWILPFFVLGLATLPSIPRSRTAALSPVILLIAGTGPMVLEATLMVVSPLLGLPFEAHLLLLLGASAVLAVGCAARLWLQQRIDARVLAGAEGRAEEARRAGRLETLVSLTASLVEELQAATSHVVRSAQEAWPHLGDKGDRVVEQARRGEAIVKDLSASLRLAPEAARHEVDLGRLLEETVRAALDEGLALHVSLDGTRRLPPVWGDARALGSAFQHLIRNASQASPGGHLRVKATPAEGRVVVRFEDDGPGVPAPIRPRIFDPFFTTRPVGEGVGLGLTHVHFVVRDHGGSVVLEEKARGASFAIELPIRERRRGEAVRAPWPMAMAILLSAAIAVSLVVVPQASTLAFLSLACQAVSSLAAGLCLAYAGVKRSGRGRLFWFLLAAGAMTSFLDAPGIAGQADSRLWMLAPPLIVVLVWASALALRPDRQPPRRWPPRSVPDGAAATALLLYLYAYFVILPAALDVMDPLVGAQRVVLLAALRSALPVWAAVLSLRAVSAYWRGLFGRLALVLGGWAVGETVAGFFASFPDHASGALSDLGWIVPQVVLAALALGELFRGGGEEAPGPRPVREEPPRTVVLVAGIAAVALFDALWGGSGHPALDAARHTLTLIATAVVCSLVTLAEMMARHAPDVSTPDVAGVRGGLEPSARLMRAVRTALYEVGGHLSGVKALARLVLAQSDTSTRIRSDVQHLKNRGETASRIVDNLMAALRDAGATAQAFSVNRLVEEVSAMRGVDLAQEGIRFETRLASEEPMSSIDPAALRHVLLSCVDHASVALRRSGVAGAIELVTALAEDQVVVRIGYQGPGLSKTLMKQLEGLVEPFGGAHDPELGLTLGRQTLVQHKGLLTARQRNGGGTELSLRIPRAF
jgi:signal transduction histidine kinase